MWEALGCAPSQPGHAPSVTAGAAGHTANQQQSAAPALSSGAALILVLAPVRKPRGSECFGDMRCPCYRQVKRCLRAQAVHGAHCAATVTQYPKTKSKSCSGNELYKVCLRPGGAAHRTAWPAAAACMCCCQPAGCRVLRWCWAARRRARASQLRITVRRLYLPTGAQHNSLLGT